MSGAQELKSLISKVREALAEKQPDTASHLLSQIKRQLLLSSTLIPTSSTSPELIPLAREALELGALTAINQQDADGFRRYYQQLQPFYDMERHEATSSGISELQLGSQSKKVNLGQSQRSKITGLYLLLLLSMGDNTMFHTVLEGLIVEAALCQRDVEDDPYIKYPVELERSLMEGSYDKVWRDTKSERVPAEEFGLFSSILVGTIRNEIADCSEKAYPFLPMSNAKNLLFLDSEGAVIEFSKSRGWLLRDGKIYFPRPEDEVSQAAQAPASEKSATWASGSIIANTLGYARHLETIV
ncbi:regulatory particle non-ATPase [Ascosphaera aggregata]|nr:regulatory particle non-ATPase [Ascosphaera aggregata]